TLHRLLEETAEDHRVGDVADMKLVKANEPVAARGPLRGGGDGVLGALQLIQVAMDLPHEMMEMHSPLAHQRDAEIKTVHEEALAAPHRTPEIHPFRQR